MTYIQIYRAQDLKIEMCPAVQVYTQDLVTHQVDPDAPQVGESPRQTAA